MKPNRIELETNISNIESTNNEKNTQNEVQKHFAFIPLDGSIWMTMNREALSILPTFFQPFAFRSFLLFFFVQFLFPQLSQFAVRKFTCGALTLCSANIPNK